MKTYNPIRGLVVGFLFICLVIAGAILLQVPVWLAPIVGTLLGAVVIKFFTGSSDEDYPWYK